MAIGATGLPRSIPERLSIHPPFIKRNVGSESDQVLVRAAIAMLMGSGRLRQPKTVPVERPADVNNYLEWIRTIRPEREAQIRDRSRLKVRGLGLGMTMQNGLGFLPGCGYGL